MRTRKYIRSFVCLALFLSLSQLAAPAQDIDRQLASHLGVGVSVGLDGFGIEAATTLTPFVQVRGGYSFLPIKYGFIVKGGEVETDNGVKLNLSSLPVSVGTWKGGTGKLLFDVFPGRETGFHFTVGAYFGSGRIVHAEADMREVLPESDWGSLGLSYKGLSVSTNSKGYLPADVNAGKFIPYIGIGFGRAIRPLQRVSVSFDMGALYTGGVKLQGYSFLRDEKGVPSEPIRSELFVGEDGKQYDGGWVNRVSDFPVFPMLKLNVFVRIF